jgi:quinol monooxygenase YgiN
VNGMETRGRHVRIAEIEIDPAQREKFEAAITEEIETSVRVEPGVLALYAVFDKTDAARVMVFEIYADETAYKTHLETSHFKAYKVATEGIVRLLKLIETAPIALAAKSRLA